MGHSRAQFNLGWLLAAGLGGDTDTAQALDYFRLAAQHGDPAALYTLGRMHWLGDLLAQDLAQALYYYKQAAAVGDRAAQFNLGFMHANAQGTEQNYELALQYYRSAAGHGLVLALTNQADPQDPV